MATDDVGLRAAEGRDPAKPDAPDWWKTLRSVLVTTGEIALKVLPILLAAIERANAGQPPRDPQLALTTGPVEWLVDHSLATVTAKNVDKLGRAVTVSLTPGSGTNASAESFVIPANGTQPLSKDVWAIIASGDADDAQVTIDIPSPSQAEQQPEDFLWVSVPFTRIGWDTNDPQQRQLTFTVPFDTPNPADQKVTVTLEDDVDDKKAIVLRARYPVLGPIFRLELTVGGVNESYLIPGAMPSNSTQPQMVSRIKFDEDLIGDNVAYFRLIKLSVFVARSQPPL